ncbi:hypothetical protein [Bradyrhizobium elkanii]|uniref:hypothetical protein n=1 Tax=Bradyrhizobium elkanii TaxID=29448 RepID=UPI003BA8FA68|nr:hypothetical protein [Bradyrhizobium elkanii]MCS4110487.1 hypothetical protein [Bradyrhizobium elkanii]
MLDLTRQRRKLISGVPRMLYDSLGDEAGSARAMDVATFEDLIDRLGEDLSRWPDDLRVAAVQLLASSAEARTLYEEASAVRRALAAPPVRAPKGLADRIVTAAAKLPQKPISGPAPADDQPNDAQAPGRSAPQGKVLPALLLALCLLPAMTPPALMLGEPDLPISLSL